MTRLAAAGAALLAAACAAPTRTQIQSVDPPAVVRSVAVGPIGVTAGVPREAPGFVEKQLLDALGQQSALRVVDGAAADARLSGEIRRWSQRDGSTTGVRRPASVWLALELRDRDERVLWTGVYEETQPPLSDDLGSLPRAWERGFRWVTAEELAEYGIRELVGDLSREAATWS